MMNKASEANQEREEKEKSIRKAHSDPNTSLTQNDASKTTKFPIFLSDIYT